tara:strand:+ start:699 stop:1286 length:588 start_codon:yes stop_codon:yes gene_type:complete
MSIEAISWSIKVEELNSTDKLLLLIISNYANADNVAWASENHLSKLCNCSKRTIRRSLKVLNDKKLIQTMPQFDNGRQIRNEFKILVGGTSVSTSPQTQMTTHNTKVNKNIYTKSFGQFWSIYPRNEGKYSAQQSWNKLLKEFSAEDLLKATELFKQRKKDTPIQYIPHASTFLNKRLFLDVEKLVVLRKDAIAG